MFDIDKEIEDLVKSYEKDNLLDDFSVGYLKYKNRSYLKKCYQKFFNKMSIEDQYYSTLELEYIHFINSDYNFFIYEDHVFEVLGTKKEDYITKSEKSNLIEEYLPSLGSFYNIFSNSNKDSCYITLSSEYKIYLTMKNVTKELTWQQTKHLLWLKAKRIVDIDLERKKRKKEMIL